VTLGGAEEHTSAPEAAKTLDEYGSQETAAAGPLHVMVGGTGVMATLAVQLAVL